MPVKIQISREYVQVTFFCEPQIFVFVDTRHLLGQLFKFQALCCREILLISTFACPGERYKECIYVYIYTTYYGMVA